MDNTLTNKYILVIGTGVSGISAAKLLTDIGAIPILYDSDKSKTAKDIKLKLKSKLPPGITPPIYIGKLPPQEIIEGLSLIVVSPGVDLGSPDMISLRAAGIPIIGETELAYRYAKGRIIAITGTNGKTTTVTLTGEIVKAHFPSAYIVGNIGRPFSDIALETSDKSVIVLEISSFQLETIKHFSPYISVILNITPDHLDRHKTMAEYTKIKESISKNQSKKNTLVLNRQTNHSPQFLSTCPAQIIYFSSQEELDNGCYLKNNTIYEAKDKKSTPIINTSEIKLAGICNIENIMAAIIISRQMNIPLKTITDIIKNFRAVPHRIEYVRTISGADYYNDSKATNPDAAIQGIRAMTKPTILIAGGSEKNSDYTPWLKECQPKLKALILIGETKDKIAACAQECGITSIHKTGTLEDAITLSKTLSEPGDAILLSPACASFGLFKNYEHRGEKFKELVHNLT